MNCDKWTETSHFCVFRLLSPETAAELEKLANSPISDMNFTRFTNIIEDEMTKVSNKLFL